MRKILCFLLTTAILFSFAGCSEKKTQGTAFKAGVYEETVKGHNGDMTVVVEFTETEIKSITMKDHKETAGLSDPALKNIPEKIISGQSLAVDTIAGATVSSKAVLAAVEAAIAKAGGDVDYYKNKKPAEHTAQKYEKTTDVVVVGAGIAGLSAAVEAANEGAKVILIEKMAMTGGSTARSGGKIQAAGTDIQKENGVTDTAEDFADYIYEVGDKKVNKEYIDLIAKESAGNIKWLADNGVQFENKVVELHPTIKPDRIHEPVEHSGAGFTKPLEKKAAELGVEIILETPAKKLITNDNGEVIGVEAKKDNGDEYIIKADSVILATGGYDRNPELMAEMAPEYKDFITNVGDGNTGDGVIMAREVGAEILKPGGTVGLVFDLSASQLLSYETQFGQAGLFVDTDGKRFMNESEFMFQRTRRVIDNNGATNFFYILDSTDYNAGFDKAIEMGKMFKADTIEELAKLVNIDPAVLKSSVDRYNKLVASGKDTDFGKQSDMLKPIEKGPFYASNFTLVTSGSFGGPKTNIKAQVMNTKGDVINGLYAAGEVASGEMFYKEYPGSGTAIQCFLTFGRIAGKEAATQALAK